MTNKFNPSKLGGGGEELKVAWKVIKIWVEIIKYIGDVRLLYYYIYFVIF